MISFVLYSIFYSEVKDCKTVGEVERVHSFIKNYFQVLLITATTLLFVALIFLTPTKYELMYKIAEAKELTNTIKVSFLIYSAFMSYIYFLNSSANRVKNIKCSNLVKKQEVWKKRNSSLYSPIDSYNKKAS